MRRRNDRIEPLRRRRQGCAPARPTPHVSMLLFAALIRALSAFGAEALFASFDVSHLSTFPWTSDAGRAGAHPYHRYGIAHSNHQTKGGFCAQTLSIRPRSGSNPRLLCPTNHYFGHQCVLSFIFIQLASVNKPELSLFLFKEGTPVQFERSGSLKVMQGDFRSAVETYGHDARSDANRRVADHVVIFPRP